MSDRVYKRVENIRAALDGLARRRRVNGWRADPLATPRPFGTMRGQIRLAPDFDDTPEDLIAATENGIEPTSCQ